VLFTDYGVSGVAVFQLSRHAALALARGESVSLALDLFPGLTLEALCDRARLFGGQGVDALFAGVFHRLLAQAIVRQARIGEDAACHSLTDAQLRALLQAVHAFSLPVTGTQAFDQAQVTAGGVRTGEIDPRTFESRLHPGLYITGESVDVDGPCGGYNLHFAFTSGILAGRAAAERSKS
jgi:predicted Rossmann fold flavoprotein